MQRVPRWLLCSAISGVLAAAAATAAAGPAASQAGIDRMKAEYRGAKVSVNPATGAARFVRLGPASMLRLGTGQVQAARNSAAQEATAGAFIDRHAAAFGLANGKADLVLRRAQTDGQGWTRLSYVQQYKGVPVFGAMLKAHFDPGGRLTVLNGATIPDIELSVTPTRSVREAEATAVAQIKRKGMSASQSRLVVYREGLAKGVAGANHLAYEVTLTNSRLREYVYVDAHTGKFIDRISGTPDAMNRRAYDAQNQTAPGPNYPGNPFWEEGDAFPTGVVEADNMIYASQETYDLFLNAFGRDSFDAAGATMDSIFNRGNACPNASWNGVFISFCPGTTSDDVTGHEWGHAYTEYTDGLIYAWQPGALNEAASDVFGETVDLLNGRQTDTPNNPRTTNACTAFTPLPPAVTINSPAVIAGQKPSGGAAFGPATFSVTNDVVLVNDGAGIATPPTGVGGAGDLSVMDGCETPFANAAAVNGKIAMMYRGTCGFAIKAKNAQLNGAVGVLISNHVVGGNGAINMAGVDATITIGSLSVGNANGEAIRSQLASTVVNATLARGGVGTDNSVRWLMGEDASSFGGAIRDMASPNCYLNPAKVSDALYHCATSDNGGVHINSGVDNRAYSLLVDGGTFNGQTVAAIGLTKAAHIWYQAKVAYQHPATDFADHADALEQSCTDLVGVSLNSLTGGGPSGEMITAADCAQVEKAVDAVEFRTAPTQCNFQTLLAQSPPDVCPAGKTPKKLFTDNFDNGTASMDRWTETHQGTADFTLRDWSVVGDLPDERAGRAFFAPDPTFGSCAPGGDESSVLHLDSPVITLPSTTPSVRVVFDHWVATEPLWDGGNVKISVNGGAWQTIPDAKFVYNGYNGTLNAAPANTNPLGGQRAYTGTDGGAVDGTWGRTIIDLTGIASPNDKIQLRFDFGTDGCGGAFGWYVDNLQVLQCR